MTPMEAAIVLVRERLAHVAPLEDVVRSIDNTSYVHVHAPTPIEHVYHEVASIGFWDADCWVWLYHHDATKRNADLLIFDYADPAFSERLGDAVSAHLGKFRDSYLA